MNKTCPTCRGTKVNPKATYATPNVLVVPLGETTRCPTCGGTGKRPEPKVVLFEEPEPGEKVPMWAVVQRAADDDYLVMDCNPEMREVFGLTGYFDEEWALPLPPDERGFFMWVGYGQVVPCGSYDGPEGGAEYTWKLTGEYRRLYRWEAVDLANGELEWIRVWNPHYDQEAECECGDDYERHFDWGDDYHPHCKDCMCGTFRPKPE